MKKQPRYPTTTAPPSPPVRPRRSPLVIAGKCAAALILAWMAIGIPLATLRQVRAEVVLKRTRVFMKQVPESRTPEVKLRKALELDPHHALVMSDLSEFLVRQEKRKIERGEATSASPRVLEEAIGLLERAQEVLPSPGLFRRRAEVEILLADAYRRRGETARAQAALSDAFDHLYYAGRLLPNPRSRNEVFNVSVITTALESGNEAASLEYIHKLNRNRQRYALREANVGARVETALLRAGMYPLQGRELRYKLERNPADPRTLQVVAMAGRDLGLREVLLNTLGDLRERGMLDANGEKIYSFLTVSSGDAVTTGTVE